MTADWLTPTYGFAKGGVTVYTLASAMTGLELQRALRKRGIDTWAWMMDRGGFCFRISPRQERYARNVLGRMGVVCV